MILIAFKFSMIYSILGSKEVSLLSCTTSTLKANPMDMWISRLPKGNILSRSFLEGMMRQALPFSDPVKFFEQIASFNSLKRMGKVQKRVKIVSPRNSKRNSPYKDGIAPIGMLLHNYVHFFPNSI